MRHYFKSLLALTLGTGLCCFAATLSPRSGSGSSPAVVDCFQPIEGGWHLRLSSDPAYPRPAYGSAIGVTRPRKHETRQETPDCCFRRRQYPDMDCDQMEKLNSVLSARLCWPMAGLDPA